MNITPSAPSGGSPVAVTADYTASAGEVVLVDSTLGARVITMPTAPPQGSQVTVREAIGAGGVTVLPGGSDTLPTVSDGFEGSIPSAGGRSYIYAGTSWYGIGLYQAV